MVPLTGAKRDVGELVGSVVEVPLWAELHPLPPGVTQAVVNSRGDADLVADRDGVSCSSLNGHVDTRFGFNVP